MVGNGRTLVLPLRESNNLVCMPDSDSSERYNINVPLGTPTGRYTFWVGLVDTDIPPERIIEIGLQETLRSPDGFYHLADVKVRSP